MNCSLRHKKRFNDDYAESAAAEDKFWISLCAFRADATNAVVCMEQKIHNLEAETQYISDTSRSERRRQQADLQFLPNGSAAAVHSTVLKQLQSLGVRSWLDDSVVSPPGGTLKRVFVFMATTDQGSDQAKFKRTVAFEVAHHKHIQFWSVDCLMHQVQLTVRSGLTICDRIMKNSGSKFKYFGSLAKLVNTWRESHKAIFSQWGKNWGDESSLEFAWRLPPRCLAGRWGSVVVAEEFIAKCIGGGKLLQVLFPLFFCCSE